MWTYLTQHHPSGEAMRDYTLAGALMLSPGWSMVITDFNPFLAAIGLLLGIALGAVRLWKELKKPSK